MCSLVYRQLIRPLLFCLDAETAHRLAVRALAVNRLLFSGADDPVLGLTIFGKTLRNPLGMAAGFDKDAEAMTGILNLGFGHTEVGTVTPLPQAGNPRPRVFRIPSHQAVINRYGFNSLGLAAMVKRLEQYRRQSAVSDTCLGVNIGKNKTAPDTPADFVACAQAVAPFADYIAVNVSSPNTPGLRGLQNRDQLRALLLAVKQAAGTVPVCVKFAPDLSDEMMDDIAEVVLATAIDGVIVTNTTVTRPHTLPAAMKNEAGGLSGLPLKPLALHVLRQLYARVGKKVPLIGVGGISDGQDAYERIRAGASLLQIYTGLIYHGPWVVEEIKRDLTALLKKDGFAAVAEAIGADHRKI